MVQTIRGRLWIGSLVVVALLIVAGAVSWRTLSTMSREITTTLRDVQTESRLASQLSSDAAKTLAAAARYLDTHDPDAEAAMIDRASPRKEEPRRAMLGYGDFDTVMDVTAKAVATGPYLMGEQFTAADVVVGSTLRWGMMFKLLPERPEFVAYTNRLAARPALQRAEAKDKELAAA